MPRKGTLWGFVVSFPFPWKESVRCRLVDLFESDVFTRLDKSGSCWIEKAGGHRGICALPFKWQRYELHARFYITYLLFHLKEGWKPRTEVALKNTCTHTFLESSFPNILFRGEKNTARNIGCTFAEDSEIVDARAAKRIWKCIISTAEL